MTLADCRVGDRVRLWNGTIVTIEVLNFSRARIRQVGVTEAAFVDRTGTHRVIRARRPARDIAPSAEVLAVLDGHAHPGTPNNAPLAVTLTQESYLQAATVLWGEAGAFAMREFQRLNAELFAGCLPPLPIVIGLTAYGSCLGLTRRRGGWSDGQRPRITLAPEIFQGNARTRGGRHRVTDTLVHEMVHAKLMLAGDDPRHNAQPWCTEITRLSPLILGHAILAAPVHVRRVAGKVQRAPRDGYLPRAILAGWPYTLRPVTWDPGPIIRIETY
jgi:hypothetical protein